MAIPFLNNITLNNNEIQNVRLQNGGNPPQNSGPGQIYFNTGDTLAKYYSNITDEFVSLKEYSFPTDTYITGAVTGTTPKPIITFDLNAVDGVAVANERYLTKNNTWAEISTIPGTYTWSIQGDAGGPTPVVSGDTIDFAGGTNVTTALVGNTLTINSTDQFTGTVTSITAGVGLTGGVITTSGTITLDYNGGDNYIQNNPNGNAIPESDSSINFNSNALNGVYTTELGGIPVDALTLVKNYIDSSVAGGVYYQGGYDATNDLTSPGAYGLQTPPVPNVIEIGWMYTVTVEGLFFGEQLRVGDVLIAEVDAPTSLADWTTVQNNIDLATSSIVGLGNVVPGSSNTVTAPYSNGTATLDVVDSTPTQKGAVIVDAGTGINVSYSSGIATVTNTDTNASNTFSGTIGDGSSVSISLENSGAVAPNINHGLGTDSSSFMIQLVSVSLGETVYSDVTRDPGGKVTIDFATAPAVNDIRVLIQKIG